ncbi:MAG: glycosyl hydrolase [Proteobacteria bacterium]|nr:glycosyl hydrolase [Pseudomonadota bacterium]
MRRRTLLGAAALLPLSMPIAAARAAAFRDVLDTPASPSPLAARGLFNGLARAGGRLVAVGQRGHVLASDDVGKTWLQAEAVPVSADLVAVHFATAERGWAVGHDGVILASSDGGRRWTRQFDGRQLGARGAENPLLDVWFDDASNGLAVGAFGTLLRTADGGATWRSAADSADNPKGLHLYAVRRVGGALFIAGEQGLLLRHDGARFAAVTLPYAGTLFGVFGNERALLAHGLRGHALRSADGGATWQPVATRLAVGLTGGALDERGRFVLVSQAGHVLASRDDGASFAPLQIERPQPAAAVASAGNGTLVLAGPRGLQTLTLP